MCSKFSRKCLSSATGKLYINIITFIRQIELCGAPHNSVAIPCVEHLMHGMALVLKAG